MPKSRIALKVQEEKIISIVRGVALTDMERTVEALFRGGIRIVEITFNQKSEKRLEETAEAIRRVKTLYGNEMAVGAGTVMSIAETEAAVQAGASFLLSPNVDAAVIKKGIELGVEMIPGALTPTEIAYAYQQGAALVKLFPAGNMGTSYARAVMAPVNNVPMIAVGGVNLGNLNQFLQAGFAGVGIGSEITKKSLIEAGEFAQLAQLAKQYVEAVNA